MLTSVRLAVPGPVVATSFEADSSLRCSCESIQNGLGLYNNGLLKNSEIPPNGYLENQLVFPESAIFPGLCKLDPYDPKQGEGIHAIIKNSICVEPEARIKVLEVWAKSIFDIPKDKILDQQRVGSFLKTALELKSDPQTTEQLHQKLDQVLDCEVLERIRIESAQNTWEMINDELALHSYTKFQNLEKLWGKEEAEFTLRSIGQKVVWAQVAEEIMETASNAAGSDIEHGMVLLLGGYGHHMGQSVAQQALQDNSDELDVNVVVSPYYRDHALVTNLTDGFDPDSNLMDFSTGLAELCRVVGSPRNGKELAVKLNINKQNEITIYPGVANVGGHILGFIGFMDGLRLRGITENQIVYPQPGRGEKYRQIKNKNKYIGFLSLGDGAMMKLDAGLEYQKISNSPIIDFIQNNQTAIAVNTDEVTGQPELWRKGNSKNIPGIRIEENDFEGLYMAIRFAATKAKEDSGPTIIEMMMPRLGSHSVQHGDQITAEYIYKIQTLFKNHYGVNCSSDGSIPENIRNFLNKKLVGPTKGDNRVKLKKRLEGFMQETDLDANVQIGIKEITDTIKDPGQEVLSKLELRGVITKEEVQGWYQQAREKLQQVADEVLSRPRPQPEEALKHIKMPYLKVEKEYSTKEWEINTSNAISQALIEARRLNPHILLFGPDVIKGRVIENGGSKFASGYWGEGNGFFEEFGKFPRSINNMPIDEQGIIQFIMGMSTTTTNPDSLAKAWRPIANLAFSDYGIEGKSAYHIHGNITYTSSGEVARPAGVLLMSGAVTAGGLMHSYELVSDFYQTRSGIDLFYATDAESAKKGLKWNLLYNNNPYIFLVDKTTMFQRYKFIEGTGFLEPGEGRLLKDGGDLQFISYGAGVNSVRKGICLLEKEGIGKKFGLFDIYSIRPFPYQGLIDYIKSGEGPIIIAHQEPVADYSENSELDKTSQAFGTQIYEFLNKHPLAKSHTRGRDIIHIGSKPTPGVPCDGVLSNQVLLTPEKIKTEALKYL